MSGQDVAGRVARSFAEQGIMAHLGARLVRVKPGRCEIELPYRTELSQQDGFFHAGAVVTVADSAAGYAAFSLMPEGHAVLTVELKVNLMAPARGERIVACGRVRKAGRTLSVVETEVTAYRGGTPTVCALLLGTVIGLDRRPPVSPASP